MNLKYFQWSSRSERGQKFSREKWCSIIWTALHRDQISFCKCFDLPGYYAGYGLCKLWTHAVSLLGLQELPATATQQINHPARFSSDLATWYRKVWTCPANFLHGSRELQATATRRMNLQRWTSKHPGLGKQAKPNWSCQSTCRSGESSGALTLSIKSLRVNVWQWWNHGPSNAPKISSAGTTTGFGFDPRQCNYWNQKGNQ